MACKDKNKFTTAEAATKSAMRTQGAIDKFLNIINLKKFRELNFRWSEDARKRFGITEKLFLEDGTKAVPNSKAFTEIDNRKGIFYQIDSDINYTLKSVDILLSDRAKQIFDKGEKNKWNLEKILSELAIPKDQKDLLLGLGITNREQLALELASQYGFKVEIKTATTKTKEATSPNVENWFNLPAEVEEVELNTGYYQNLTVPGGINYTENEISTPLITPSIKGHAQFSTDKGIGWFRSDEKTNDKLVGDWIKNESELPNEFVYSGEKYFKKDGEWQTNSKFIEDVETVIWRYNMSLDNRRLQNNPIEKTRRILEIQSDLFQKGRDKEQLVFDEKHEYVDEYEPTVSRDGRDNQFLQLLNKDNNWVTFFIKSIVQDSAKKGYEKVLFPKGETAAKIEGHETIAEEIRRIDAELIKYNDISKLNIKPYTKTSAIYNKSLEGIEVAYIGNEFFYKKDDFTNLTLNEAKIEFNRVKDNLEQQKVNLKSQGIEKLKPIEAFYEIRVGNILEKIYGKNNVNTITDEYGNQWREITINKYRDLAKILLQKRDVQASVASSQTLSKVKEVIKKMGIDLQTLSDYIKGNPDVNTKGATGLADLSRGIIAIAEGKEDVALTEEMVHVATAMLEQTSPSLVTQMISKIGKFKIYNQVLEAYKNNPAYQLPNGNPDIRKIKKEAVDKLIAEVIINQSEGSTEFPELLEEINRAEVRTWWQKILDWFRGAYKKANIDIFEQAAQQIMSGEVQGELTGEGVFFQISEAQKNFQRKIMDTALSIEKVESKEKVDPLFMDTEEANNWYQFKATGEKIKKRVTDLVKAWYRSKFPSKTFTKEEEELNEFKRNWGIKGHKYFEEIHARFFNKDGTKRDVVGERPVIADPVDRQIYMKLENYFVELMKKFSENGKSPMIFSEVIVYSKKKKQAGTLDLLIVEEDGKAHIFDWKFMSAAKDSKDVAWYKQGAYNIQLREYKDTLISDYGVKSIGMNRAIPILFDIEYKNEKLKRSENKLKGIVVGSFDTSKIENLTLMPVSEESESTETLFEGEEGWEKLDRLIERLNSIFKQISKKKAIDEDEKEFKRESLNALRAAIRAAQSSVNLSPLIKVITLMRNEGEMLVNDWETIYKDKSSGDKTITDEQLSEFAERLREYKATAEVFKTIDKEIGALIYTPKMEEEVTSVEEKDELKKRKQILENIREEAQLINDSFEKVDKIIGKFADKFMGLRNLVSGLLSPRAIVRGLKATFTGLDDLPLPSLNILFKMVTNAKAKATREALAEVEKLMSIRKKLADKGGDLRELSKRIYQKDDKGNIINKLIYKFKKDFYKEFDNNALEGERSKKWIEDNVDVEAYKKEAQEILNKRIDHLNRLYKDDKELLNELIIEEKRKWDITREDFNGWNNYALRRHPLAKWYSDEYIELKKDDDLLELYNFISDINDKAAKTGYISNKIHTTFLPYVRKGLAESLAWDFSLSAVNNWSKELTTRAGDVGYGQVDELTGAYEYSIPKYYTYDFTAEDGSSEMVSEDLFKNLILYINHMEKYNYLTKIEEQLKLVKDIEQFKGHLDTARNGDVIFEKGRPVELKGNAENFKLFDVFLRATMYEQKYPLSEGDTPLEFGKAINAVKKELNRLTGMNLEIEENPSAISLTKSIDAANRAFQLKTLGLEFISGAVNYFGTNIQIATQSGNYYTGGEVRKNQLKLIGNKFKHDEEREMFIQLNDLFMPMREDPTYERLKDAGMSKLTRANFSDMLMVFMRDPELHIEKSIFLTLLQNTMVENGKLVNIREYVKSKYKDRYSSQEKYRESSKKIEEEIEELQKTRSIDAIKKLEDGKLVIPGLDLTNTDELQRLTNLTKRLSRNAVGGMTETGMNQASLNIWLKSAMVFKNWIPKLLMTRFRRFERVNDDFSVEVDDSGATTGEKYDIGRVRLFASFLSINIIKTATDIINVLEVNDKGILKLDELYLKYSEQYKLRTGEDLDMSREDFNDLIITNLRNQVKELALLLSLAAASFALGFIAPDDDDNRADKNFYRFSQRVFDKFIQELSFFYNPAEFQKMLSGSAFPAMGLVSDILRASNHIFLQITGYDFSDPMLTMDEVREKAQPIKNTAKIFPITKSMITYGAILSEDFAKEFDVTIQKEARR